jgi:hypothetical protein
MPCIYTVVRKVARYETRASSKAQLITKSPTSARCPLYLRMRTSLSGIVMSAFVPFPDSCAAAIVVRSM